MRKPRGVPPVSVLFSLPHTVGSVTWICPANACVDVYVYSAPYVSGTPSGFTSSTYKMDSDPHFRGFASSATMPVTRLKRTFPDSVAFSGPRANSSKATTSPVIMFGCASSTVRFSHRSFVGILSTHTSFRTLTVPSNRNGAVSFGKCVKPTGATSTM